MDSPKLQEAAAVIGAKGQPEVNVAMMECQKGRRQSSRPQSQFTHPTTTILQQHSHNERSKYYA